MTVLRNVAFGALAALLLVAQARAQTEPAAPDPATLRSIETQVAQIRGLQPRSEPDLRLLDHTSLNTYLNDQFAQNYSPDQRETDQKEMVALGLIQPSDDLVKIELNLLNDQVIGVYDPDAKALFVVSDQGAFGPAARITYAHEFNHALQDQYYDLNKIAPKHPDSNDRALAARGLIEGDAIMLQSLWAQQNLTHAELLELLSGDSDTGLAEAPLIVRSELLFPYTAGFDFVRQAYRQANNSFAAIDSIFTDPPKSTAQVLHPEKYRAHVLPLDPALPDVADGLGPEWRGVGAGVLGELDTHVLLQQWGTPSLEATRVAAGWSGDRWQLVERNGRTAIVMRSTWASDTAALDFYSAYTGGLQTRFANSTVEESSAGRQALTTVDYATDVRLLGSDVLVIIGPDRATTSAIANLATSSAP
jgi:hypothetical protein